MSTIKSSAENLTLNADGANNDVIIQSNGSTKVTVDGATGNVGVGQTTPASNNSSPRVLHIGSSGDSKASIVLEENGSTGSNTWEILSDDELQIRRGSSQKMYFKTDGLAVFNNGVALGGTGAANTLNDYEEGTWSPAVVGGTQSVSVEKVTYTKIGRLVTLNVYVGATSVSDSTSFVLSGLPFAAPSNGYNATGVCQTATAANTTTIMARTRSSTSNLDFYYSGSQVGVPQSGFHNHLIFSITYATS